MDTLQSELIELRNFIADLKADRAEGVLRIRRFTREPGVRGDVDTKLERAAARLARTLGLAEVAR